MITGTANQNPDPYDNWITCKGCKEELHISEQCDCGYEEPEPDYDSILEARNFY